MKTIVWILSGALLGGCGDPCQRDACEEINKPAAAEGLNGIAGTIAYESDVVINGCEECSFDSASLELWAVAAAVQSVDAAKAVIAGSAPTVSVAAHNRYRQPLAAGSYLLCAGAPYRQCINVTSGEGTTTVHVRRNFGPTQFIVFEPGSAGANHPAPMEVNP